MRWRNRAHASAAILGAVVAPGGMEAIAWNVLSFPLAVAVVLVLFVLQVVTIRLITSTYADHGWY